MFATHRDLLDPDLARALKVAYDDLRDRDPARACGAAEALSLLAELTEHPQIIAFAKWVEGLVELELGAQAETAIAKLDEAAQHFQQLGQSLQAAATQIARLYALALLGRYDEAVACGLEARTVLLAHNDLVGVGKVELNLGNICYRRDRHAEAELFYRAARTRFITVGDDRQLLLIETNLATALIYQHKFRDAEALYQEALARAQTANLVVMQAIIECDLGCLNLLRGRYGQALGYLETSRRQYAEMGMLHESAIAELELADAYLELNLAPEAAEMYARTTAIFAQLGMRAEQARAQVNQARACLARQFFDRAREHLQSARFLFQQEDNRVGEALVALTEAQIQLTMKEYAAAATSATRAESQFPAADAPMQTLLARWLRGEAARCQMNFAEAHRLFSSILQDAAAHDVPQIRQRCHTSLGLLAAQTNDAANAEAHFQTAIAFTEDLRVRLPADEFRAAFATDKLTPYREMVRLCLAASQPERKIEALTYVERARSRVLRELMGEAGNRKQKPRDAFEAQLFDQLAELREELNWLYNQMHRLPTSDPPRTPASLATMRQAMRERESQAQAILRQLQQLGGHDLPQVESLKVAELQDALPDDTALVEYFDLDGELIAFIVTRNTIKVVRELADETRVMAAIKGLRLQLTSLRFGAAQMHKHMEQLTARTRHHLQTLYELLLSPLHLDSGMRRLVIVPHRLLHYVPFHALYDGTRHVIENHEVCYAPSAAIFLHGLQRPRRALQSALLLAITDEQTPQAIGEVNRLAPLFARATRLREGDATQAALRAQCGNVEVLHFACHGQFRADNPLFSALKLADGWLTVREASELDLDCELVTLSACETGMNDLAPGDEWIGLARGFFSAGTPTLVATLWTVADEEAAELMTDFYQQLLAGDRPATALRTAQCRMLKRRPHPFFWSPFVVMGRW